MNFLKYLLCFLILILSGCTYQQKIFLDGATIADNVAYSYNGVSRIKTQSILIKKFKVNEDDESYVTGDYCPFHYNKFKKDKIKSIQFILNVDNTANFSLTGKGYYYKLYRHLRNNNDRLRTLDIKNDLVYAGHLSHKLFTFNLPTGRGDKVSYYLEFKDKQDKLLFRTLKVNYEVN